MRTLLLVRNAVSHDARVLRAARVAQQTLGGRALIAGVATANAPAGRTSVEGVSVVRLQTRAWVPLPTRARRILSGARYAWRALRLARSERPLLVHANDWNTMWCALAIKLACRARVVYDSHELWADRNGRWEWRPWLLASEALFMRAADAVVTASPGYADVLARRNRISRPTVVRNIPENGRQPRSRAAPGDPPLLVYVGGLMPGRGLEQTIDALALVPRARLRAVGPGAARYREELISRARALGVESRVELAQPVPPAAIATLLARATAGLCLIQPVCRSYELTLPNKLFEYAAAGVPVLASDLPVIAAVVQGEGIGEVVPAREPQAIAVGLRRLAEPRHWRRAAHEAERFAAQNGWEEEAGVLAQVYSQALRRAAAAPRGARELAL